MAMTTLGVLCTVIHLRTFGSHRTLLHREITGGVAMTPYYLSQVGQEGSHGDGICLVYCSVSAYDLPFYHHYPTS